MDDRNDPSVRFRVSKFSCPESTRLAHALRCFESACYKSCHKIFIDVARFDRNFIRIGKRIPRILHSRDTGVPGTRASALLRLPFISFRLSPRRGTVASLMLSVPRPDARAQRFDKDALPTKLACLENCSLSKQRKILETNDE